MMTSASLSMPDTAAAAGAPAADIGDPRLRDLINLVRDALAHNATRSELLALIEDIADVNRDGLRAEPTRNGNGHGYPVGARARLRLLEQLTKLILALRTDGPDFEQRIAAFVAGWPAPRESSSGFEQF